MRPGTRPDMPQTPASVDIIFRLLRELPETTRTDLVARTGLSKATVSETIAQLLANDLVTETGKRQPGRGRRQVLLQLRNGSRLVIGAEFNEHGCRAVLADLRAGPVRFADRSFTSAEPEDFVNALEECVAELRAVATAPVLGIGIGAGIVAGFVIKGDPYYGHVGTAGELGHTTVEPDGPQCGCGNQGCLYMLASESAIVRHVREAHTATPVHVRASHPPLDVHDGI